MNNLTRQQQEQLLKSLREQQNRNRYNKLKYYAPYNKQVEFHNAGLKYRERLLMAGNQLGKTFCASMEIGFHATGLYPHDWKGLRFDKAPILWVCGVTGEVIRDTSQRLIAGRIDADELGEGSIPKDLIVKFARGLGVKNLIDHLVVKHISGRNSLIYFKSYSTGREKFQGETIDLVWFDEEPPIEIYSEGLTRTSNGQHGIRSLMTFTPLLGRTKLVNGFLQEPTPQQRMINMTLAGSEQYTDEQKESMMAAWPAHEREARANGVPMLGSGKIFVVNEDIVREDPIPDDKIPAHWFYINGLDFGWDHPSAAVQLAYDADKDVIHVVKAFRQREALPIILAHAVNKWAPDIVTTWPHDGYQHDKGSGLSLRDQYEDAGLYMTSEHATHEAGGNGVEAGILEMQERMATGRLRVGADLIEWWEEYRMYHRKNGKIVKVDDDLLCATRYAIMMLRHAEQRQDKVGYELQRHHQDNIKSSGCWD